MGSARAPLTLKPGDHHGTKPKCLKFPKISKPGWNISPGDGWTHHDGEDDGGHGGFEDPEHGQADDLHQREEVDAAQRHVPEEDVVRLVLGWHEEEFAALPELRGDEGQGLNRGSVPRLHG